MRVSGTRFLGAAPGGWPGRRAAWSAVAVAVALAGAVGVARGAPGVPGPGRPIGDLDSPCRASVKGMLSQTWVSVGQPVVVRTRIALSCPERRRPYHVAFAVDAAASRAAGPMSILAEDLRHLGDQLALASNRFARAGVVAYGAAAETVCAATQDPVRLAACLDQVADPPPGRFVGQGALADGIREAAKVLYLARSLEAARPSDDPLSEGLVVIEGQEACAGQCRPDRQSCRAARQEAALAQAGGVELSVVCLAQDCQASCLADLADHAYNTYQWDAMVLRQSALAWRTQLRVERVDMSETLDRSLVVDPQSVDYTAGTYDAREHGLTWHLYTRERSGDPIVLSYAVTPTQAGTFPVRLDGGGVLVDTDGLAASFTVPPHQLRVSDHDLSHLFIPRVLAPPPPAPPPSKPLGWP
jgi:hypothetical protein